MIGVTNDELFRRTAGFDGGVVSLGILHAVPSVFDDRAGVIPESDEEERLSVFRQFVNSLDVELEGPGGPPADEAR